MASTEVRFLGTASVVPERGNDTSTFLINDRYLFDAGWWAAINMLQYDVSPLDLDFVFLSHCHQDHYLGLAQIAFYMAMNRAAYCERPPIRIYGPKDDIARVMDLCFAFLQTGLSPQVWTDLEFDVIGLDPGAAVDEEQFRLDTCKTVHKVQSMCCVFTDKLTGTRIAYTGDTSFAESIADCVKGVDLLVHEASAGEGDSSAGHSGARDAARIADLAGARRLALVHCREEARPGALAAAREIFPDVILPQPGQTIKI